MTTGYWRKRRPYCAQSLVLALLFFAAAPIVSAWHNAQPGSIYWATICTTQGAQRVALNDPTQPNAPQKHTRQQHCPWCQLVKLVTAPSAAVCSLPAVLYFQSAAAPPLRTAFVARLYRFTPPAHAPPEQT